MALDLAGTGRPWPVAWWPSRASIFNTCQRGLALPGRNTKGHGDCVHCVLGQGWSWTEVHTFLPVHTGLGPSLPKCSLILSFLELETDLVERQAGTQGWWEPLSHFGACPWICISPCKVRLNSVWMKEGSPGQSWPGGWGGSWRSCEALASGLFTASPAGPTLQQAAYLSPDPRGMRDFYTFDLPYPTGECKRLSWTWSSKGQ
jgi:hypothetical protein